jgi:serine/threonine protein kinase
MSRTLEKGTVVKDRYRIEKLVGKGGQKRVYLATDISGVLGDRKLALKEMMATSRANSLANMHLFEQEAIILKGLRHPAIPLIFDYFADQGTFYIIEEYIEGESLSNLLHRHTFSQEEVLTLAIQMADVLHYLHRSRPPIVYRDLKPQNVKVFNDRIYLIDFSGALLPGIGDEAERAQIISRGYTPPGAGKRKKVDFTYDTYSLGVVIYEMLTRYDVKSSEGNLPDIRKVRQALSPEICEIVNRAVFPGHYWQYQTMWEMKMELTNALNSIRRLKELEEREHKDFMTWCTIVFHRFRISFLQPFLAFFIFLMIGLTLSLPSIMVYLGHSKSMVFHAHMAFLYLFSLYVILIHIVWGRWFGGVPALSKLYRRFHTPVAWMGGLRLISILVLLNVCILVAINIYVLIRSFH